MVSLKLSGSANPLDLHALDEAITKTERGIRVSRFCLEALPILTFFVSVITILQYTL